MIPPIVAAMPAIPQDMFNIFLTLIPMLCMVWCPSATPRMASPRLVYRKKRISAKAVVNARPNAYKFWAVKTQLPMLKHRLEKMAICCNG